MDIKSGKITNSGYDGEMVLSVESSKDIENLKKGEEIRVWINGELLDSQPLQGSLGTYETIEYPSIKVILLVLIIMTTSSF